MFFNLAGICKPRILIRSLDSNSNFLKRSCTVNRNKSETCLFSSQGNMAAFDMGNPKAVVSPGGVGFDINCGVRLLRTNLTEKDVLPLRNNWHKVFLTTFPLGWDQKESFQWVQGNVLFSYTSNALRLNIKFIETWQTKNRWNRIARKNQK